ncbi:hypothetical protein GS966_27660 [Rhodococcus hoagii]|nr:hypothetical protein [Prescottella equi]NKZ93561.1 hypothetical protein [Prescottella equi]
MAVRVICEQQRDMGGLPEYAYTGPLPEYTCTYDHGDPLVGWLAATREAFALAKKQPSWIDGVFYPQPDGPPWSAREIGPVHRPYEAEFWYSAHAWRQRLPGSRYGFRLETLDPGFTVTWTLEIV